MIIHYVNLYLIHSCQPEIKTYFARTGIALWQALRKLSILYQSQLSYKLISVTAATSIPPVSQQEPLSIFYFLCGLPEIETFFAANFRSTYHSIYILNSDRFSTNRELRHFRQIYRLPDHTVFTVSSNLAFQAALSRKQENQFITFYNKGYLRNQNYDYIHQLKQIHFLAAAHSKGDSKWMMTNY